MLLEFFFLYYSSTSFCGAAQPFEKKTLNFSHLGKQFGFLKLNFFRIFAHCDIIRRPKNKDYASDYQLKNIFPFSNFLKIILAVDVEKGKGSIVGPISRNCQFFGSRGQKSAFLIASISMIRMLT